MNKPSTIEDRLRDAIGMRSVHGVAKVAGVNRETLRRAMAGLCVLSEADLSGIAKACLCSPAWLIRGDGDAPKGRAVPRGRKRPQRPVEAPSERLYALHRKVQAEPGSTYADLAKAAKMSERDVQRTVVAWEAVGVVYREQTWDAQGGCYRTCVRPVRRAG